MRHYKTNSLFGPGADINLNACVGLNGGPYGYFDYALGYFQAGTAILRAAEARAIPVDIAVYPLVYNFRHAVELSLKHFATQLPRLFESSVAPKLSHRLNLNWDLVKPFIARDEAFDPGNTIPPFDQTVRDLTHFDPTGEVFRFPETRTGSLHLQDAALINLAVVGTSLAQAESIVTFWNYYAESLWESLAERWPEA